MKKRNPGIFSILLLCLLSSYFAPNLIAGSENAIPLKPVYLDKIRTDSILIRTIYSIQGQFSADDSVVFLQQEDKIQIQKIRLRNENEIVIELSLLPGFNQLGIKKIAVVNSRFTQKVVAHLPIRYQHWPTIKRVWLKTATRISQDTLQLQALGTTSADLILSGKGFFPGTEIHFDDPNIQILNDDQHRLFFPPDSMLVRLLVHGKKLPRIGSQRFTIAHPYILEGEGRILVRDAYAPKITGSINNYIPDGTEKELQLNGIHLSKDSQISTLPAAKNLRMKHLTTQKIKCYLTLPIQQENQSYRLVVTNPDGQADTSNYFFAMAKPLAPAKARTATNHKLFSGREELIEITVRLKRLERLNSRLSYEINFGTDRFPIDRIKNDSTLIARVHIPQSQDDAPKDYHNFTVKEVGRSARWKGVLITYTQPTITYMSSNRIIHPMDTLQVLLKGTHFSAVKVSLDDPELTVQVLEAENERLRFLIIAGRNIARQAFPLILEKGGVKFKFPGHQVEVRAWEKFNKFVALETPPTGTIAAKRLWSGREQIVKIKSGDYIFVKLYGRDINPELGEQKVVLTGFLLDSVNTIRAEAFDKKMIRISHGNEIITWRFRVRQRVRSGDRVEIMISNPGNQNRAAEFFYVERRWFEAFRGSTSIPMIKIPLSGGETELLKNIAFGINWQPWSNRKFISFDGSFIIGNPSTNDSTVSIEIGFGVSAIILNYIQIGVGTNLTGQAFDRNFLFIGSRFKLPFPK